MHTTSKIYQNYKENKSPPTNYNISTETELLYNHIYSSNHELNYIIYAFQTVPLSKKTIQLILHLLKTKNCHTYSLFRIKLLKILNEFKSYVPISKFILEILILAIENKKVESEEEESEEMNIKKKKSKKVNKEDKKDKYSERNLSLDFKNKLKIGSNKTTNKEYIIKKTMRLIFQHLNKFSNNVGFPELANFILFKISDFEILKSLKNKIERQKIYVENLRKELKCLDSKTVKSFSKSVKKMEEN